MFTEAELAEFSARYNAAFRSGLTDLIDAGARNFLIAGAPNAGGVPDIVSDLFPGDLLRTLDTVQPVTDAVNDGLQELLAALAEENPGANFYFFDADLSPVLRDPEPFGLDPELLTTPFLDDLEDPASGVTLEDLPRYAFIDDFHPTAIAHDLFADLARGAMRADADVDGLVAGGPGAEALNGGAGRDAIQGGGGGDTLKGFADDDLIAGEAGDDILYGVAGDDILAGGDGNDRLVGGGGDDALAGGAGNDVLIAGVGADILNGGAGADRLKGQIGADRLDGDTGDDKLIGGGGADVFVFRNASTGASVRERDVIVDFQIGLDSIDLTLFDTGDGAGFDAAALEALLASAQDSGGGAVLDLDAAHRVVLRGVSAAELSDDFFLFG